MESPTAAFSPGRVVLIGGPDYTGTLIVPMAIELGTTVLLRPDSTGQLRMRTDAPASEVGPASVELELPPHLYGDRGGDRGADWVQGLAPRWVRLVAAALLSGGATALGGGGLEVAVSSTLPLGAGLASSAALLVSTTLASDPDPDPADDPDPPPAGLAQRCRASEELAAGIRLGLMDYLACLGGVAGHVLALDCATLALEAVPLPAGVEILIAHSGETRQLSGSRYAERRRECDQARELVGPLASATRSDLAAIADDTVRRRATHVVAEAERARQLLDALRSGDLAGAGELLDASQRSLAELFEVCTPALDDLAAALVRLPGVHGARLTGGGFGGCVVALAEVGSVLPEQVPWRCWVVEAAGGAHRQGPSEARHQGSNL